MLVIEDKDRISWSDLFEHEIIKFDSDKLKQNINKIRNPKNKKLAMKILMKQINKTKTMLKIVGKINKHIKKNIKIQKKYEKLGF